MSRIAALETVALALPYARSVDFPFGKEEAAEYLLLRVRTESGHEGIAEAVARPRQQGEDAAMLAHAVEHFFAPMLVGVDALEHGVVEQRCKRIRAQQTVKNLIDVALWDLKGKLLGQPVWRLLGGARQDIPLAWIVHGKNLDEMLEEAVTRGKAGYALKLKIHSGLAQGITLVRETREAVGPDVLIYADANFLLSPPEARRFVRAVAEYDLAFMEEPCRFSTLSEQARFVADSPIAFLGDQTMPDAATTLRYASAGATGGVSIKPRRSGITESLRILGLCRAAGLLALIGTDSESRVGAMARMHLRAGLAPSFDPLPNETHFFDKLAGDPFLGEFQVANGQFVLGDEPGFGAAIDEERLKEYAV